MAVQKEIPTRLKPGSDARGHERDSLPTTTIAPPGVAWKGSDDGVDPLAELNAIRNVYAHYTPAAISYKRVWGETITDLDRITVVVAGQ